MATKQKLFLGGLPLERCFPVDSAIQHLNNWGVDSLQTADAFPVIAREATTGNASCRSQARVWTNIFGISLM